MGVEQSTPLDFRSLPHPYSSASNCEKDVRKNLKRKIILQNPTWRIINSMMSCP
jgi:hypothetical protein